MSEEILENENLDKAELDDLFGEGEEDNKETMIVKKSVSSLHLPPIQRFPQATIISVRTPIFLKFQPKEYDPLTYNAIEEKETYESAISFVRWRVARDSNGNEIKQTNGEVLRESNARMIKWSDGTYQIVVGDQIFNTTVNSLQNTYTYKHQTNIEKDSQEADPRNATCLECTGKIHSRMKIQSTSLAVETNLRKAIKSSQRFNNRAKIEIQDYETIQTNPEYELEQRIREEELNLRKERKQKEYYRHSDNLGENRNRIHDSSYKRPSMSADYLLQSDDEDEENNIKAIKNRYQEGRKKSSSQVRKPSKFASTSSSSSMKKKNRKNSEYIAEEEERSEDEDEENDEDRDFIEHDDELEDDEEEEEDGRGKDYTEEDDDEDEDEEEEEKKRKKRPQKLSKTKPSEPKLNKIKMNIFKEEGEDEDEDEEPEFEDSEEDDEGTEDGEEEEINDEDEEEEDKTTDQPKVLVKRVLQERDEDDDNEEEEESGDEKDSSKPTSSSAPTVKRIRRTIIDSDEDD